MKKISAIQKIPKLLLYDDQCKDIGTTGSGGGYRCKSDNTWDKSRCYVNYCKIGYYFDRMQNNCVENCKIKNEKSFYIYEDNFNKVFDIQMDTRYNFFFPFYGKKIIF